MFLAGSYKCKNHFLSATVDVVPWPTSSFSCVVFYDGWFVDFAVGHRDCATYRTGTVFDVEGMLPRHHVQVLYPALLSLLCLAVILGITLFLYPTKLSQQFILAFQEVCLCVSFVLFLIILCYSLHYDNNNETKTVMNSMSNVLSQNICKPF